MAAAERLICAAAAVPEAGAGVRFELHRHGRPRPGFVIRWQGRARAYVNECAHIPVELDYQPGHFFDFSGCVLVCATHGALYDPATGACVGGRCNGTGLTALPLRERDGGIYLVLADESDT